MQGLYNILNISAEPKCVNRERGNKLWSGTSCTGDLGWSKQPELYWETNQMPELVSEFRLDLVFWVICCETGDSTPCSLLTTCALSLGAPRWSLAQRLLRLLPWDVRWGFVGLHRWGESPFCFCVPVIESWVTQSPLIHPLKYSSVPSLCCLLCSFYLHYLPVVLV